MVVLVAIPDTNSEHHSDIQAKSPQGPLQWPPDVVSLLVVLTELLVYFQCSTLSKFGTLPPAVRYTTFRAFVLAIRKSVPLGTSDSIVGGLILAVSVSPVALEIWKGRLSTFLKNLRKREADGSPARLIQPGLRPLLLRPGGIDLCRRHFGSFLLRLDRLTLFLPRGDPHLDQLFLYGFSLPPVLWVPLVLPGGIGRSSRLRAGLVACPADPHQLATA